MCTIWGVLLVLLLAPTMAIDLRNHQEQFYYKRTLYPVPLRTGSNSQYFRQSGLISAVRSTIASPK